METTNTENLTPAPPPLPKPPRRRARIWPILLLLLLAGAGAGYYWLHQKLQEQAATDALLARLTPELAQLKSQVAALANTQDDQAKVAKKNAADLAALGARVDEAAGAIARLGETVQGGRTRVQLAAIEQVLLTANDRALLAHDAAGAETALEQADARLAALNEPKLFKVREAIAQERAALQSVPKMDLTAAVLNLSNLLEHLPQLPLQGHAPAHLTATTELASPPAGYSWPMRLWASLKQALHAVFVIRHSEADEQRLLPPEQEVLVVQIGLLKIEGVRLALLRGNTAAFRELCGSSAAWLKTYFESSDPGVQAAQTQLQKLSALEPAPALPDISHSLTLLRGYLAAP